MKKRKKKLNQKIILTAILLIILTIAILVLFENGFFEKKSKETKKIELKDKCSLMFNRVIHQIKTEDVCKTMCKNECNSQNLNYLKVEFVAKEENCNTCNCYCDQKWENQKNST